MKKLLAAILSVSLMISGCTTPLPDIGLADPVQAPPLPENLAQRAGPLPQTEITNGAELVLEYGNSIQAYNKLSHQTNGLITFYQCVREALNNETDPEECLNA
jgi:hypothetical protein